MPGELACLGQDQGWFICARVGGEGWGSGEWGVDLTILILLFWFAGLQRARDQSGNTVYHDTAPPHPPWPPLGPPT